MTPWELFLYIVAAGMAVILLLVVVVFLRGWLKQ